MISQLQEQIETLLKRVETLEQENAELRRRLSLDSHNSSQPPSSDAPWKEKQKKKKKKGSGRKPGGQKGHKGHHRMRFSSEQVDRTVQCQAPSECSRCGGVQMRPCGTGSHQVVELLGKPYEVVQYNIERVRCSGCGQRRSGKVPVQVRGRCTGPRLDALMSYLSGAMGCSRRKVQQFVSEALGLGVSLGTVSEREAEVASCLKSPTEQVTEALRQGPFVHVDETGHRHQGKRQTTWVLSNKQLSTYRVGVRRNRAVLRGLLGSTYAGVVHSDRYAVYNVYDATGQWQLCWAHLYRNVLSFLNDGTWGQAVRRVASVIEHVLHVFGQYRNRGLPKRYLHVYLPRYKRRLKREMRQLMNHAQTLPSQLRELAKTFLYRTKSLWNFWAHAEIGIEPTNNQAERDIRPFVLKRKTSLHTWSERGKRFLERALTVLGCCTKQATNPLNFFYQALLAYRNHSLPPSLLPTH